MTTVKHAFVSPKADGGDNTLVQPTDWNADHDVVDYPQVFAYPEEGSLSGDSTHWADLTGWTDNSTNPFTVKEILGGSILHLQQIGPSKVSQLTRILSDPKSPGEAYDFRFMFVPAFVHGNSNNHSVLTIRLGRADYPVWIQSFQLAFNYDGVNSAAYQNWGYGNGGSFDGTFLPVARSGEPWTVRMYKGTDNVVRAMYQIGSPKPLALVPLLSGNNKNEQSYDLDSSGFGGTGAQVDRIDIILEHAAAAAAAHQTDIYFDYVQSV